MFQVNKALINNADPDLIGVCGRSDDLLHESLDVNSLLVAFPHGAVLSGVWVQQIVNLWTEYDRSKDK